MRQASLLHLLTDEETEGSPGICPRPQSSSTAVPITTDGTVTNYTNDPRLVGGQGKFLGLDLQRPWVTALDFFSPHVALGCLTVPFHTGIGAALPMAFLGR